MGIRKIFGRMGETKGITAAIAIATAVAGGCLLDAKSAQAAPVTLQFTFSVDDIQDSSSDPLFGGPIQVGDKLHAAFTFDAATPDGEPADGQVGFYEFLGAPSAFTLQTPNLMGSDEFFGMVTNDGPEGDVFTLYGYAPINVNGFDFGAIDLIITDPSHTWLSSDAPPTSLSAIAQLAGVQTFFQFKTSRNDIPFKVNGHLVFDGPNDPPPAVPEPASFTLLGTGLVGLVKLRRARRASRVQR